MPRQLLATVLAALGFFGFAGAAHAQKPAPRARAAATATLDVTVTNGTGTPLEGIGVSVSGPVTRQATTNAEGAVRLQGLKAGTYRLRFDGEGWISLEREAVVAARSGSLDVHVMLTEAPPPPPPPPPPDPPAREPEIERPVGEAKVTNVADFADRNLIRGNEPQRLNVFGCTGYATTRLLQIRDPLDKRLLDEADETIYVLAGEGVLTIDGKPQGLKPGVLAVIPRGTDSAITRRSRGPLIAVSVVSGPPCTANEK